MREEEPATYVRVLASILPKHVRLDEGSDLDGLSDEQIEARIRALDGQIAMARVDRGEE